MGRDGVDKFLYDMIHDISTHTPAWGATKIGEFEIKKEDISTHTPAWGATMNEIETLIQN